MRGTCAFLYLSLRRCPLCGIKRDPKGHPRLTPEWPRRGGAFCFGGFGGPRAAGARRAVARPPSLPQHHDGTPFERRALACLSLRWKGRSTEVSARKAAKRWFTDSGAKAEARRDEALRRLGADVVNEPIPAKLQQALGGEGATLSWSPKAARRGAPSPCAPPPAYEWRCGASIWRPRYW
jgi:hypothetical protein